MKTKPTHGGRRSFKDSVNQAGGTVDNFSDALRINTVIVRLSKGRACPIRPVNRPWQDILGNGSSERRSHGDCWQGSGSGCCWRPASRQAGRKPRTAPRLSRRLLPPRRLPRPVRLRWRPTGRSLRNARQRCSWHSNRRLRTPWDSSLRRETRKSISRPLPIPHGGSTRGVWRGVPGPILCRTCGSSGAARNRRLAWKAP